MNFRKYSNSFELFKFSPIRVRALLMMTSFLFPLIICFFSLMFFFKKKNPITKKRGRRKSKTPRETSYPCLHRFHATRAPSCRARTWSTYVVEFLRETSYPCLRRFQCNEGSILQGSDMVYCDGVGWNDSAPLCLSE